jgi:phosphoenolpyruvate carboxykinase (ATP)
MITAALNGELDKVEFEDLPIFKLRVPKNCPNVPAEILNPRNTWKDKAAYDAKAADLAQAFIKNFQQYAEGASEEILSAAPTVHEIA